jgi:hypothetical protein
MALCQVEIAAPFSIAQDDLQKSSHSGTVQKSLPARREGCRNPPHLTYYTTRMSSDLLSMLVKFLRILVLIQGGLVFTTRP